MQSNQRIYNNFLATFNLNQYFDGIHFLREILISRNFKAESVLQELCVNDHKLLIVFSVTVKAATLIFISGCGSAI